MDEQLAITSPEPGGADINQGLGNALPASVIPTEAEASVVFKLAQNLARTTFVPVAYQNKPDEIAACMLFSRAIHVDPMIGLQEISVIQGRPAPSAKLQAAKAFEAGHRIEVLEWSDTEAKLRGTRKDGSSVDVAWTLDDAKRAGLLKAGSSWEKYPRAMLMARATSALCRAAFPECVLGMAYNPEEIGGEPAAADLLE